MKPIIIGIAGQANSGKDTVASMISYMLHEGAKATFADWVIKNRQNSSRHHKYIIHFADPLKECISSMFNINIKHLNDREYKDKLWFCLNNRRFYKPTDEAIDGWYFITEGDLRAAYLSDYIYHSKKNVAIKLRTLMQHVGTDICRHFIDKDLWAKSTITNATRIANRCGHCVIADTRFVNEADMLKDCSLYGGLIKINREDVIDSSHPSEYIDFNCNYEIDNNSTLLALYYKVSEVLQQIIKRYENN